MSSVCLQLYYQPKINVDSNEIIGYEILLRNIDHPPYYPAAKMEKIYHNREKHSHFLVWLKKELTRVLVENPSNSLSINFSPRQLLYPETKQFFSEMRKFCDQLIVEITEDPILLDITEKISGKSIEDSIIAALAFIKELGYNISLDDVGTGQNSFERALEYVPYLNQIKFSIVKCLKHNASLEMIDYFLKAWHQFARENHLEIVIEGIEDQETSKMLVEKGMLLQQGYYFGKPAAERVLQSS